MSQYNPFPKNLSAGGASAIGDTLTGGTAGSVLFVGAGGVLAQDNSNFFWDDTNNYLGIGTNAPDATLHVTQAAATSGTPDEALQVVGGAHTGLDNAEAVSVLFDLSATVDLTGGGGAITAWRAAEVLAPTFTAAAAQTISAAATFYIDAAPTASTNITITDTYAFWVDAGNVRFDGKLGIGTTSPLETIHVGDGTANSDHNGDYGIVVQYADAAGANNGPFVTCINTQGGANREVGMISDNVSRIGTFSNDDCHLVRNGNGSHWVLATSAAGGTGVALQANNTLDRIENTVGTEAIPAYTFSNSSNSGMWLSASGSGDTLGLGCDAAGRVEMKGFNGLQANSEKVSVKWTLDDSFTITGAGATIGTWRTFWIDPPTIAGNSGANVITNAATLYISQAPQAGTNVTVTNGYALWVDADRCRFDGGMTFAHGAGGASATYNATVNDFIIGITHTPTAAVTVNLPAASACGAGAVMIIKDEGGAAGTNNITVDPNSSETIDGLATWVLSVDYESVSIYSDGSNWFVF